SLDVRDREGLEAFLADVQDPSSPRYRQFLSQADFDALYAPTSAQEEAVVDHLRGAGLRVTERFPNRLLVGAAGSVAALERAFGVEMHSVQRAGKRHYAALDEPSLPAEMASYVVGVIGLDDLSERHPHVGSVEPAAAPRAALGSNCCHLSPHDVEYAHGTAPAARVLNYMSASTSTADFTTMYNRIVTDNPGHVVSTSWGACEVALSAASQQTDDNIFANANAIGQSWFAASGDRG